MGCTQVRLEGCVWVAGGTLKISMTMGMHFFVKQRGRVARKQQWWGNKIMGWY